MFCFSSSKFCKEKSAILDFGVFPHENSPLLFFIDIYKEFSSISIHAGDFWITYKVILENFTQVWHLHAFYTDLWIYFLVNVFLLNLPSLLGVPYLQILLWHHIPLWPPWVLLYLDPLSLPGKITVTSATVMQDMLLMWGKSIQLVLLARDS